MSVLKTYPEGTAYAPSRTFRIRGNRIEGIIDGLEAVRQAALLILSTERFAWPVFSPDYGVELEELIGERRPAYVDADLERRIAEALTQDDRIIGIRDFALRYEGESADVTFTIETGFGETPIERRAPLG